MGGALLGGALSTTLSTLTKTPKPETSKLIQPTPTQINRQDTAQIQSKVTRPSIDQQHRDHFAQATPEYTGGMEGARARQAKTAVIQAQAQVNAAQKKLDAAEHARSAATPTLPEGVTLTDPRSMTGPVWQSYLTAVKDRSAADIAAKAGSGELFDAKEALGHAQAQKAELDRERELLADVSTSQWDQRIRDQYATPDQYGRVSDMEVRSQKIKAKKGMVQAERDHVKEKMDAAQRILFAEQDNAGDYWDPTHPTKRYAEAWRDYQTAKDRLDELDGELNELSNLDYPARNESAFGRMATDPEASKQYVSAAKVKEDQQKLNKVIGYYQRGQGGSSEEYERISKIREELAQNYGLSEGAIIAYVGGYEPYDGQASVQQIVARINTLLSAHETALEEKDGEKTGYDFHDQYGYEQRLESQQGAAKRADEAAKFAREHPVISTASTVPVQFLTPSDLFSFDPGKGKPGDVGYIPPDTSNMVSTNYVQTVRGAISSDLERDTDMEFMGQNVAAFLYNANMSMADSAAAVSVLGPGSVYLMGTNAAVTTVKNVADSGGTTEQAVKLGIVAGIAEVLFDKIPVERLLEERTVSEWREMLTLQLTKRGIKCSEEMLTEGANILAEIAVLGRSSDYAKAVDRYQRDGKSESQAKQQAFLDMLGRVGGAGMGGL